MELFCISVQTATPLEVERYKQLVSATNQDLHRTFKTLKTRCTVHEERSVWFCSIDDTRVLQSDGLRAIYHMAAEAVGSFILEAKEQQLVEHMLDDHFDFSDPKETGKIVAHCMQMLVKGSPKPNESWNRRLRLITKSLTECLEGNSQLNVEGFLTFRMKEYGTELREIVEYAVDEFLMDRQYEEFVGLLKYFVYFQEPKVPLVHIVHKGGQELMLLDEHMNTLEYRHEEGLIIERLDQQDMAMEDAVVSTLISISPAKVIIHTREPQMPVIMTLLQIFDERIEICGYCPDCNSYFRETGKI
ncbi:putative sporulation protein YtxC [Paenibacillus pini]|uniref:Sporulation protein YtxC n=1 Tax=Paenibacillus pini JCM 16418 TaxID=1236976 RepID=W7YFC7_9BACL|nr:putative sporulation protein YtxC [Paenibacillus pini]GAF06213.1 hypothetical protein JCM16418_162 [Paenibacillus pini JCM 16418]